MDHKYQSESIQEHTSLEVWMINVFLLGSLPIIANSNIVTV